MSKNDKTKINNKQIDKEVVEIYDWIVTLVDIMKTQIKEGKI